MTVFEEEQKIEPKLAGLIYAIMAAVAFIVFLAAQETGDPMAAIIPLGVSLLVVALLFATMKMTTRVSADGVHIKMLYFISRTILFDDIKSAEPTTYRPLLDYGGYGYRLSHKGKAYNMRGEEGVQLRLKNGGAVMIGSMRADELAAAITARLS